MTRYPKQRWPVLRIVMLTAGMCAIAVPLGIGAAMADTAAESAASAAIDNLAPQLASTETTTGDPTCAWPQQVGADAANVFLPDSAATYWVMPYQVHRDLRITLSGHFPDARYFSFDVYDGNRGLFTSNDVPSAITDYQVAPDQGQRNPWQQLTTPGGAYTLTVRMAVGAAQTNVLPLAPPGTADGSTGTIVYRVYLPAGGDPSALELPTVTMHRGTTATTLPMCDPTGRSGAARDNAATVQPPPMTDPGTGAPIAFERSTAQQSLFPNADNAYLEAWVDPPGSGSVVVIRAKAPRATSAKHPVPWPNPRNELRYWSMCTNLTRPLRPVVVNELPNGGVDYGCRYDDETTLDTSGWYTYMIGTEAQRPIVERVPGVTFLPLSTSQPNARHLVLLRNMVPADGFATAVQRVPQDGKPVSAAAVMGEYYPRATVCTLATVIAKGAAGCAATA